MAAAFRRADEVPVPECRIWRAKYEAGVIDDPQEREDLGADAGYEPVLGELKDRWFEWMLQRRTRVTISDETIFSWGDPAKRGFLIGYW